MPVDECYLKTKAERMVHDFLIRCDASEGIVNTAWQTGISTAFALITTETIDQTIERSGNNGAEAVLVATEIANLLKLIYSGVTANAIIYASFALSESFRR